MKTFGTKVILQKVSGLDPVSTGKIILPPSTSKNQARGIVISCPEEYVDGGVLRRFPLVKDDIVVYGTKSVVPLDNSSNLYFCELYNIVYVEE